MGDPSTYSFVRWTPSFLECDHYGSEWWIEVEFSRDIFMYSSQNDCEIVCKNWFRNPTLSSYPAAQSEYKMCSSEVWSMSWLFPRKLPLHYTD